MSFANNHIDKVTSSNSGLILLFTVGALASALAFFPYRLINWLINIQFKLLSNLNKKIETVLGKSKKKEFSTLQAQKKYTSTKKILSRFCKLYSKMEKADFFKTEELHSVSDRVLTNLYLLENHFKMLALADKTPIPEDKNLIDFASTLSLGSTQA